MPDEHDHDEQPQIPSFFQFLLGGDRRKPQSDEETYQSHKGMLTPSWVEVVGKDNVGTYFTQYFSGIASHVTTCSNPECPHNNTMAMFMDPKLFVRLIIDRIKKFNSPEATALCELWINKDPQKVEIDPRYIIARCQWDSIMVASAIMRECMADPMAHLRGQIE